MPPPRKLRSNPAGDVIVLLFVLSISARGQLSFLNYRESEAVVARIPEVRAAAKAGECPLMFGENGGPPQMSFMVRCGCGPDGGMHIGTYVVDRKTGAVATWGDDPTPVGDSETRRFAQQLVNTARKRSLTADEGRCLALAAVRSLPGWNAPVISISVETQRIAPGLLSFDLKGRIPGQSFLLYRTLNVDPETARVQDWNTLRFLMSKDAGAMAADLLATREPDQLDDPDLFSVVQALKLPNVTAALARGCKLHASVPFTPWETEVSLDCGAEPSPDFGVAIDIRTGAVRTLFTSQQIAATAESAALAGKLLAGKAVARQEAQADFAARCAASPAH